MVEPVEHIPAADLVEGDPTPGMVRRRAFEAGGLWTGLVTTEPGAVSGWHHHGDHETSIYVAAGGVRLEHGPGGSHVIDAVAGDFVRVPPHTVHRESNPGDAASSLVVSRSGTGPVTVNTDGPQA
jgi:uncharacterized RmlC-like cupin family protein